MTRQVPEWIGKKPQTPPPARVKDRIIQRQGDKCLDCGRPFDGRLKPEFDHRPALINGGENRESKIFALCPDCHGGHTRRDVAEKSKVATIRKKRFKLSRPKWRPLPGTKASGMRKRMNGQVEKW